MKFIDLKGQKMPALGFGTYQLYGDQCADSVEYAIECGYTHIDTAQIYENEEFVGEAIKKSGKAREDLFLTTKVWRNNFAADDVERSVDDSLQKLQTEYVDLLLVHWPFPEKPVAWMVEQVMKAREAGKAKAIGVSNFTVAQIEEAMDVSGGTIICDQVEYHPYLSQKPVLECLHANNLVLTAYSPVARGAVFKDKTLRDIGEQYGKNAGQVTLRWHMQQHNVAAIPKSGTKENIKSNFEIFDFELTDADMQAIHALARPDGRQISPDWGPKWDAAV